MWEIILTMVMNNNSIFSMTYKRKILNANASDFSFVDFWSLWLLFVSIRSVRYPTKAVVRKKIKEMNKQQKRMLLSGLAASNQWYYIISLLTSTK